MKKDKYEVRVYFDGGLVCPDPGPHYERTKVITKEQWALENPTLTAEEDLKERIAIIKAIDKLSPSPVPFIVLGLIMLIIFTFVLYIFLTI